MYCVTNTNRCKQQITLNSDDLIVKIKNIELLHEQESIEEFFAQVGISRDT